MSCHEPTRPPGVFWFFAEILCLVSLLACEVIERLHPAAGQYWCGYVHGPLQWRVYRDSWGIPMNRMMR